MTADTNDIAWNVDMEVNLFHAMRGHKPAGVNRHFQMIAIHDRLSSACKRITSDDVWSHLSKLYDLQALNESEIIPFPNKSGDFDISDNDSVTDLCEKPFPRTPYSTASTPEVVKSEGQSKSGSKSSKQDSKSTWQTPKSEKTEKSSSSKSDSRSVTPSSRSEHKSSHSSSSSKSASKSGTPEPSPKRTKRTRNVPSANASPATPTEPPAKRRR